MTKKSKWLALSALSVCGSSLFTSCLGAFWEGLSNTGWPTNNPWLNLAVDIAKEATIYAP